MLIEVMLSHPENALMPMVFMTLFIPKDRSVAPEQFSKTLALISVTRVGMLIDVMPIHAANALMPMVSTFSPMVRLIAPEQSENAFVRISVTLSDIIIDTTRSSLNALAPMVVILSSKFAMNFVLGFWLSTSVDVNVVSSMLVNVIFNTITSNTLW